MIENKEWYVLPHRVRQDYVRVENLQQWLITDVPNINPSHPKYIDFWSRQTKRCIEGLWGKEWGKFRYMPGNLYFFGNYGVIEHTWEDERGVKVTEDIKPLIVDFIWDYAYQSWVARGFSGFEKDDNISCHLLLQDYYKDKISLSELPLSCISFNGEPKKYEDAFEYLLRLHDTNLGKSLFQNPTVNYSNFGSRGSSKSYWSAVGELEYNFVFAGAQRYDEKYINNEYKCEQCAGAHEVTKSAEMVAKFAYSQKCKTDESKEKFRNWFGIWVEQDFKGETTVIPSPFYKHYVGNLECPNKENKYKAVLKQKVNGKWVENVETSSIAHVNYSDKKLGGERAAEGGRYLYSVVEECGSASNLVAIMGANEGTLARGGVRIGYQAIQGTSGNLISVQSTKKIFLDPRSYNMIAFKNVASTDGVNGETGYFVPYHITLFQFKDKNGNTDFVKALKYVNEEREKLSLSKDPKVLRDFMMNKPCYVHEMWITDAGYYLPYEEAAERERELMKGQMYKRLGQGVVFKWDEKVPKGVSYDVVHDDNTNKIEPIYDFPIPKELKDPSGCVVIYEQPIDNPPKDFYIYCCDPYVEEDLDKGGSLAVTYIIKNPKYIALGHVGHFIVASYIGKPSKGLSYYYEQQEKLIQYYGNFPQSFWYDARGGGETLRDFYIRKGKQYILCLRPNHTKGDSMYERHTTTHGVVIGNKDSKKTVLKLANDKLLETNLVVEDGEEKVRRNIFRIPCIFLIRQIMQYNMDDNFDAVSSFYIGILGLNETEAKIDKVLKQQRKVNIFEGLLNNGNIFKQTNIQEWRNEYKDSDLVNQ